MLRNWALRYGVDPDAAAWAAAVTANGGTYSAATLAAVSAFVISAKASGYWPKLNRLNLFCGDQLAACLVPLKVGGGGATDTNVNFVGGDYAEATGLTGNGTTKYLQTGFIPSTSSTINDTHLAVYNRSSTGGGCHLGASSAAAQAFSVYAPFTDGKVYSDSYSTAAELASASAIGTPFGFIVDSRTATNAHSLYRNASSIASEAVTVGALPTHAISVFARNSAGSPLNLTANAIAGYSIGSGLTAGDVTAYNTHLQAFQTALGRNV